MRIIIIIKNKLTNIIFIVKSFFVFLESRIFSIYKFKFSDFHLHLKERFWKTSRLDIIKIEDSILLISIEGRSIYWPANQKTTGLSWLFNEVFYPFDRNPASYSNPFTAIPEGGWVVDAGACEGFFSMLAIEQGARNVIAIEPVPLIFETLKKTMSQYQLQNPHEAKVSFHKVAIADKEGRVEISTDSNEPWDSSINAKNSKGEKIMVPLLTLDSLIEMEGLNGEGLIKMDIEGAEMLALKGAQKILHDLKPKLAIAVYHDYKNAMECKNIILQANPDYKIIFRGMYLWISPPRPYLLFAY